MTLPLAHLGHYLWILYLLPVLIVVAGIVFSIYSGGRRSGCRPEGSGSAEPDATGERPRDPLEEDDPPGG